MLVAKIPQKKSSFEPIGSGTHLARIIWVIDLGEQLNKKFNKLQHKVLIAWECPKDRIQINGEDKPRVVSEQYTMSMSPKANLRLMIEGLLAKTLSDDEADNYPLDKLLNQPCIITTKNSEGSDGKKYTHVAAVAPLMIGMTVDEAETPIFSFDLDEKDAWKNLDAIPEWIQNIIKKSETYIKLEQADDGFHDINKDELPF